MKLNISLGPRGPVDGVRMRDRPAGLVVNDEDAAPEALIHADGKAAIRIDDGLLVQVASLCEALQLGPARGRHSIRQQHCPRPRFPRFQRNAESNAIPEKVDIQEAEPIRRIVVTGAVGSSRIPMLRPVDPPAHGICDRTVTRAPGSPEFRNLHFPAKVVLARGVRDDGNRAIQEHVQLPGNTGDSLSGMHILNAPGHLHHFRAWIVQGVLRQSGTGAVHRSDELIASAIANIRGPHQNALRLDGGGLRHAHGVGQRRVMGVRLTAGPPLISTGETDGRIGDGKLIAIQHRDANAPFRAGKGGGHFLAAKRRVRNLPASLRTRCRPGCTTVVPAKVRCLILKGHHGRTADWIAVHIGYPSPERSRGAQQDHPRVRGIVASVTGDEIYLARVAGGFHPHAQRDGAGRRQCVRQREPALCIRIERRTGCRMATVPPSGLLQLKPRPRDRLPRVKVQKHSLESVVAPGGNRQQQNDESEQGAHHRNPSSRDRNAFTA